MLILPKDFAACRDSLEAGLSLREQLKDLAKRLLRVHPLRTADALQLAAALVYRAEGSPLDFVCLDERLCSAAEREGFIVIGT